MRVRDRLHQAARTRRATLVAIAVTATVLTGCGPEQQPDRAAPPPSAPQAAPVAPAVDLGQATEAPVVVEALPGGAVLLRPGDSGAQVREIQSRLRSIQWLTGDVDDDYDESMKAAVAGFQAKRGFEPVTGLVDERTLAKIEEMTTEPTSDELNNIFPEPEPVPVAVGAPLDSRCVTGRAICADKTSLTVRWVVDGEVLLTLDSRYGGDGYFTREGLFSVYRMSRDHVSNLYETSMPFAMFFSGGQAVHYSPDFASVGYNGSSHGCINTRDYDGVAWLFDQVRIGDKVVVYRS